MIPVWLRNFRSQQVRALDTRRHGLIEASAGTGKTFAIEHLVLRLLVENPDWNPEEILLLSFTDKAVAELRERIRDLLHAQREDVVSPRKIAGWSPAEAERIRQVWLHADDLSIQTLHAFCQSALRRDPIANHALLRTELVTDGVVAEVALDRLLREEWPADPQRLAELADALGIGGGDQWRRKLIALALKWQPWRGDTLDPDRIPDPAALDALLAEVDEAVRALPTALQAVEAGSFPIAAFRRSFAFTATGRARKNPDDDLRKDAFQKLFLKCEEPDLAESREAWLVWFRKNYSAGATVVKRGWDAALPGDAANLPEWRELARLCGVIRNACDPIIAARARHKLGLLSEAAQDVRRALDEEKTRRGLISYEDMPRQLVEALRRNPALAARLGARYKVCIVDEFQDTDPLQWEILEALCLRQEPRPENPEAAPPDALPPPALPLFLVGDPKQAIYSFRGGDLRTYLTARARFRDLATRGRAQGLGLDANHRSRKSLIELLNAVFAHPDWFGPAPEIPADGAWQLPGASDQIVFTPVSAGRTDEEEVGPALVLRDFGAGTDGPQEDGKSREPRKSDVEREVRGWIAARIAAAIRDQKAVPQDFAVLTRANAEGEAIARMLRRRGVPCRIRQKHGPFHGPAADALRLLLEWIDDAASPDAQTRILMLPFARRDGQDVPRGRPARCPPLIARWAALAREGRWPEFFLSVLHEGGYRDRLTRASEADAAHFEKLTALLSEAGSAPGTTARMLCERFDAMRRGEEGKEEGDSEDAFADDEKSGAVSIMTLHLSKGLEFRHVFIAATGAGSSDDFLVLRDAGTSGFRIALDKEDADFKQQADAQAHEEDKRLYYVGFTRARETLYTPLLPPKFFRTGSGPLGGFAADALRAAAQNPRFAGRIRFDEEDSDPVVLDRPGAGGEGTETSGKARATLIEEARAAFARRRTLTSYSRLALRGAAEILLGEDGSRAQRQEAVPEATTDDDEATATELRGEPRPDLRTEPRAENKADDIITAADLPPGAAAGTALHALLEHTPFASVLEADSPATWLAQPGRRARVEEILRRESVGADYALAAARAVWNAVRAPLPEGPHPPGEPGPHERQTHRLADIAPADLHHEVEFLLSCDDAFGFTRKDVSEESLPHDVGMRSTPRGIFLWGFIDLVYRREGRYYLLDWKSNLLPAYDADTILRSMNEHRYHLQWKLYAVALDRWLARRLPGYDPAIHFGGVQYLYLRGTTATRFAGFTARPTPQELRETYPREIAALLAPQAGRAPSSPHFAGDSDETR